MNTSADAQWEPTVLRQVHLALERDVRLDPTRHPITLAFADGVLTMDGELADIAAKKRAARASAQRLANHGEWTPSLA